MPRSPGSCPIIPTSGLSCLAGILFESAGENPARRTKAREFSVQSKITCVAAGDRVAAERFTVEQMSCAGNCAVSPTVIVDDEVHGRVVPSQVAALLEQYK